MIKKERMIPNSFAQLCVELGLKPEHGDEKQLQQLEQWCYRHISADTDYWGDWSSRYQSYLNWAQYYLDEFVPQIPQNISIIMEQWKQMNVIQFAAYQGYERYLHSLTLHHDLWSAANAAGMTPLHLAAFNGHVHTVETLLMKGAKPEKENKNAQLPIFSVLLVPVVHEPGLIEKKERVFRLLKSVAPDTLLHQDDSGDTVLHLMASYGFSNLVQELLDENTKLVFYKNPSYGF